MNTKKTKRVAKTGNAFKKAIASFSVLVLVFSQIVLPIVPVFANTELSVLNAIGNYDQWDCGSTTCGNKIDAVTDLSPASYISSGVENAKQSFKLAATAIPDGSVVLSVGLFVTARKSGADQQFGFFVENGTQEKSDSSLPLSDSFVEYGDTLTMNPFTAKDWLPTDFATVNFGVKKMGASGTISVSKIRVVIDYLPPVANPNLSKTCGKNIILVLDSSGSMNSLDIPIVKSSAHTLVNALLPATPSKIGVIEFDQTVRTTLNPTNNKTLIDAAIDNIVSDGETDWEAVLKAADSLAGSGDLVVIITDGNPNRSTGIYSDINDAFVAANSIKTNSRILVLGVDSHGSTGGLNLYNLELISGNKVVTTISDINDADVYMGDIDALSAVLADLSVSLCGGKINVKKVIDTDGNPATTVDQAVASGWSFNVKGTGLDINETTGTDGFISPVETDGATGPFSVSEISVNNDYNFVTAQCTGSTNNGSLDSTTKTISGIAAANNNIISCTFYNTPKPKCVIDSDCSDGLYCNGVERCVAGSCVNGTSVSCETHSALGTCGNAPDGNSLTWDYRAGYSEVCNENTDSCDAIVPPYVHTCDKAQCGAGCAGNSDCPDTVCGTNGCAGKDYYTYANASHTCQGCACTTESCAGPVISYNDPACTECQVDANCTKYNATYCDGTTIKQDTGVCANYVCQKNTTTVRDCNNGIFCDGAETCSLGACVAGTPLDCTANNIFAISECNHDPDTNPWTKDTRSEFKSACVEETHLCGVGDLTIAHACSKDCDSGACAVNADCNDENQNTTDTCDTATCKCSNISNPTCGDGAKNQDSEQCDAGTANGTPCVPAYGQTCDYCTASCAAASVAGAFCGDGTPNGSEQCDDGNSVNDDRCSNTCTTNNIPGQKSADVAVTKTVEPASVKNGQQALFTIHITNSGPDSAASTTVTDVLPSGLTFVSATTTAGIYNSATGLWSVGSMASGQSETLEIAATVTGTQGTTIINHVTIAIDPNIDVNFSNNAASATIAVATPGTSGGGNPSTGGDKMPTGGVTPQVAGASTEKLDLDEIQRQLDIIKQKISDIAAQIAKLPKGVLGATDVSTGACDNPLPEGMDDTGLLTMLQKLRNELCIPETAQAPTKPAKK